MKSPLRAVRADPRGRRGRSGAFAFATRRIRCSIRLVLALMIALAGQGWNMLGGYGGQILVRPRRLSSEPARYVDCDPAVPIRRQRLRSPSLCAIALGAASRRCHRLSQLSRRVARLLFCACHARLRRGVAHCRQRLAVHRRRGGHAAEARRARPRISSSRAARSSSGSRSALVALRDDRDPHDRTLSLRRLSRRDPRERGRRRGRSASTRCA